MKFALINDLHLGVRGDSPIFIRHQAEFFTKIFFPYLKENGIKTIVNLGDTFDRRKYINFLSLKESKDFFFSKIAEEDIDYHMITGNHDTFHTNTNDTNSIGLLLREYPKFHIYEKDPVELSFGSVKVLLCPWVTKDNAETFFKAIKSSKAVVVGGHFDIVGFDMMKGMPSTHGFDRKLFEGFDSVYSGHYHHPSEDGNIKYLGAQYEMNWSDYGGKRGFHVYDTDTRDLTFIENPNRIHHKLTYEDTDMTVDDVNALDFEVLKDKFVKVIVKNRTKPYVFDLLMERLSDSGTADVKSIEDTVSFELGSSDDVISESKNTRDILHDYVDTLETKLGKGLIKKELDLLYTEALNLE